MKYIANLIKLTNNMQNIFMQTIETKIINLFKIEIKYRIYC